MGITNMMRVLLLTALVCVAFVAADELKDLSSADAPAPVGAEEKKTAVATEKKADLGESEGWGGALMTSGSFTLMASNAVEEEEGELGEGEGWGGALMTSGSFTMMASNAVE